MPTVLRLGAARFFFYSLEGAEPPHIHIETDDGTAKFWLEPVALASSRGGRPHELNRLRLAVLDHRQTFLEAWHGHFRSQAQS